MESADLNPLSSSDDHQLENWLHTAAARPPLPDAGFSHRVLAALPPSTRQTKTRRLGFYAAGTVAGLIVALSGGLGSDDFSLRFEPALMDALVQSGSAAIFAALGVTLGSLWYAFRTQLRFLSRLR